MPCEQEKYIEMKLGIQGGMVAEGSGVPLLALKTAFCVQIRQAGIAQELDTPRKPQPGFHGERQSKHWLWKHTKRAMNHFLYNWKSLIYYCF